MYDVDRLYINDMRISDQEPLPERRRYIWYVYSVALSHRTVFKVSSYRLCALSLRA